MKKVEEERDKAQTLAKTDDLQKQNASKSFDAAQRGFQQYKQEAEQLGNHLTHQNVQLADRDSKIEQLQQQVRETLASRQKLDAEMAACTTMLQTSRRSEDPVPRRAEILNALTASRSQCFRNQKSFVTRSTGTGLSATIVQGCCLKNVTREGMLSANTKTWNVEVGRASRPQAATETSSASGEYS